MSMNLGNLQIAQSNQPDDLMTHLGGVLQVADNMEQHQMNRAMAGMQMKRQQGARNVLQQAVDPATGQIDHQKAIAGLYAGGYSDEAQKYEEHLSNLNKAKSESSMWEQRGQYYQDEAARQKHLDELTGMEKATGLMNQTDQTISEHLNAAMQSKNPDFKKKFYQMGKQLYDTTAQQYGRPVDLMPDNPTDDNIKELSSNFGIHAKEHQDAIIQQINDKKKTVGGAAVGFQPPKSNELREWTSNFNTWDKTYQERKPAMQTIEKLADKDSLSAADSRELLSQFGFLQTGNKRVHADIKDYIKDESIGGMVQNWAQHAVDGGLTKETTQDILNAAKTHFSGYEAAHQDAVSKIQSAAQMYKWGPDAVNAIIGKEDTQPQQSAAPAQSTGSGLPRVTDHDSYNAIKSGQKYIDPNGKIRTKG